MDIYTLLKHNFYERSPDNPPSATLASHRLSR
jgi:hypothetical protein